MKPGPAGGDAGLPDGERRERVYSDGCILALCFAVVLAVIVIPALIWGVGILIGQ
jgi:hypothetical protein